MPASPPPQAGHASLADPAETVHRADIESRCKMADPLGIE
jgi:hypothetical protein